MAENNTTSTVSQVCGVPVGCLHTLYVGDLGPDVSENVLLEKFGHAGVVFVNVYRDRATGKSRGYAFVSFQNRADAQRVLDTFNYQPIMGRPCRITWYMRDHSLLRSGVGNIFIKNLDQSIDNKALHGTFSAFGSILSCKVETDDKGSSKGFGFVLYNTQESADLAIQKANGMLLNGKMLDVSKYIPGGMKFQGNDQSYTDVFVHNLGEDFEDQELITSFEWFGSILNAVVIRNESGNSLGCGYVKFARHDSAAVAVEFMHGSVIKGRPIYCCPAKKKDELQRERKQSRDASEAVNLYITNLEDGVDDKLLREEFAKMGDIKSSVVITNKNGRCKGYGFVCFFSPADADKAITLMNGRVLVSKPIQVSRAYTRRDHMQRIARGETGVEDLQ